MNTNILGREGLVEYMRTAALREEFSHAYIFEGENLYALDFLIKCKEKVDLIYIDPPYNTKNSNLTYKDNLLRSEWISFMEERLKKALFEIEKNYAEKIE